MKKIIRIIITILLLLFISLAGLIFWLTVNDYKPDLIESAEIVNRDLSPAADRISIFNWNLGYGGLGKDMDFFMDGGSRVRAPEEEYKRYWNGIKNHLNKKDYNIYFFQEVDRKSTRSYKEDQYETISRLLGKYNSTFAPNYKVKFIPSPTIIGTQYGSVHSGLAIYSQYAIDESVRVSLPGNYQWPKKVFFLDRCMLVSKIKKSNGKTIVLINTHKSAYDKGGFLKKKQLDFIKEYAEKEYKEGHYVIIGGDWNSYMPGTDGLTFPSEEPAPDFYQSLPENWKIDNWNWAVDKQVPTNRSLEDAYKKGATFSSVIDGFLLSPNVKVISVKTIDLDFQYSDHNPMELILEFL